ANELAASGDLPNECDADGSDHRGDREALIGPPRYRCGESYRCLLLARSSARSAASCAGVSCVWASTLPVPASTITSSIPDLPGTRMSKEYTRQVCSISSSPSWTSAAGGASMLASAARSAAARLTLVRPT